MVRKQSPAVTRGKNPGPRPTLAETLVGGISGLDAAKGIPFIELGGGGGGLLSKIARALSGGKF